MKQDGLSIVETLIAISILAIAMMGFHQAHQFLHRSHLAATKHQQALILAENRLEEMRSFPALTQHYSGIETIDGFLMQWHTLYLPPVYHLSVDVSWFYAEERKISLTTRVHQRNALAFQYRNTAPVVRIPAQNVN